MNWVCNIGMLIKSKFVGIFFSFFSFIIPRLNSWNLNKSRKKKPGQEHIEMNRGGMMPKCRLHSNWIPIWKGSQNRRHACFRKQLEWGFPDLASGLALPSNEPLISIITAPCDSVWPRVPFSLHLSFQHRLQHRVETISIFMSNY